MAALADYRGGEAESSVRRIMVGGVIALLGVGVLAFGLTGHTIQLVGVGAVAIFIAAGMLAPVVARPMASVLGRPLAGSMGVTGRLGRENSMRSPKRTAQTASALMVGLALVATMAVFGASLDVGHEQLVTDAVKANYIVSASGSGPGGFSSTVAAAAARVKGVTAVSSVYVGAFEPPWQAGGFDGCLLGRPVRDRHSPHDGRLRRPGAGSRRPSPGHDDCERGQPVGRVGRACEVRVDRRREHAGRRDLQAECPARELPHGRRLLPRALQPAAAGGRAHPDVESPEHRGKGGGRRRLACLSGANGPDEGRVPEDAATTGEPVARARLRASWRSRSSSP